MLKIGKVVPSPFGGLTIRALRPLPVVYDKVLNGELIKGEGEIAIYDEIDNGTGKGTPYAIAVMSQQAYDDFRRSRGLDIAPDPSIAVEKIEVSDAGTEDVLKNVTGAQDITGYHGGLFAAYLRARAASMFKIGGSDTGNQGNLNDLIKQIKDNNSGA